MTTAADLPAEVARNQIKKFQLAAELDVHPTVLWKLLTDRAPLSPAMASRITATLAGMKKAKAT